MMNIEMRRRTKVKFQYFGLYDFKVFLKYVMFISAQIFTSSFSLLSMDGVVIFQWSLAKKKYMLFYPINYGCHDIAAKLPTFSWRKFFHRALILFEQTNCFNLIFGFTYTADGR